MLGDACQDVGEPGLRIDIVHLGCDNEAVHDRGSLAAAIGLQAARRLTLVILSVGIAAVSSMSARSPAASGSGC